MTWSTVAEQVERVMGEAVLDHRPLPSLASQVYAATLADTGRVVVKVPRIEEGRLSMPRLMDLLRRQTDVPVPDVLAVQETAEPSFVVLEYVEGRHLADPDALAPAEVDRFAREFGAVLGALHGVDLPVETFGRLRCGDDGALHTVEGFDSWRPRFADTMAVNLDALEDLRLGDLADPVRAHLEEAMPAVPDVTTPALHYHDATVENVVLAPGGEWTEPLSEGGLFEAVLDWEALATAHWAYPLAFFETSFAAEQSVRPTRDVVATFHASYADARGWEAVPVDPEWFDTYRLAAHVLEAASPRWLEGRDDWPDAEAARLRSSIRELL